MPFKNFGVGEVLSSADVDLYLMSQVIIRCTSSTRPSSPAAGWHIYETDTNAFLVYNGSVWVPAGGLTRSVMKPTDQQVTNSTTLVNDTHLVLPVDANTNYNLDMFIIYSSNSATMIYDFSAPAGAIFHWHPSRDETLIVRETPDATWHAASGPNAKQPLYIRGSLKIGSTAGSMRFRFAQQASNASPTIIRAQSTLTLTQVAQ